MQPNFNPEKIKLIIGLGNPDDEHKNTYHNAGHLFISYLKKQKIPNAKHRVLNTDCYMNESGAFVKSAIRKQGLKPEEVLIAHDDSDLTLGKYKIAFGRGAAGHKGVESVIKALGTKNFWRLRIGIRPEKTGRRAKAGDFVLKKISSANEKNLEKSFEEISRLFPTL